MVGGQQVLPWQVWGLLVLLATTHVKPPSVRHLLACLACLAPQPHTEGVRYLLLSPHLLRPQALRGLGVAPWMGLREKQWMHPPLNSNSKPSGLALGTC